MLHFEPLHEDKKWHHPSQNINAQNGLAYFESPLSVQHVIHIGRSLIDGIMFWRFLSLSSCFLLLLLLPACQGQQVITLTPEEFFKGTQEGLFDAIVDVRSAPEFRSGHIKDATLVANLASTADEAFRLIGCESCSLVVYCNTGNRAAAAIERLRDELGYGTATLYNGLGMSQWIDAGFPVVIDDVSTEAPCTKQDYACLAKVDDSPTTAPVSPPTSEPLPQPSCGALEGSFCESGDDCCSRRCVLNQCKKKIPVRKTSLSSSNGFGGSAGVAKRNNNNRRRRYLKSRRQMQQQQQQQQRHQQRLKGEKS